MSGRFERTETNRMVAASPRPNTPSKSTPGKGLTGSAQRPSSVQKTTVITSSSGTATPATTNPYKPHSHSYSKPVVASGDSGTIVYVPPQRGRTILPGYLTSAQHTHNGWFPAAVTQKEKFTARERGEVDVHGEPIPRSGVRTGSVSPGGSARRQTHSAPSSSSASAIVRPTLSQSVNRPSTQHNSIGGVASGHTSTHRVSQQSSGQSQSQGQISDGVKTVLDNPWRNGSYLNELVASLLTDNRAQVKQVEHYDNYGRLLLPPKLLLVGAQHIVKSKAQAIHNIQLAIQALRSIPHFPPIEPTAEMLYESPDHMQHLLTLIQHTFSLPTLTIDGPPIHIAKHRRSIAITVPRDSSRERGRARRSSSAPPELQRLAHIVDVKEAVKNIQKLDQLGRTDRERVNNGERENYYRRIPVPPRWRSPSPTALGTETLPIPIGLIGTRERSKSKSPNRGGKGRSKSYSPPRSGRERDRERDLSRSLLLSRLGDTHDVQSLSMLLNGSRVVGGLRDRGNKRGGTGVSERAEKAQAVRQLESMRERLNVQRRDRRIRRDRVKGGTIGDRIETYEEVERRVLGDKTNRGRSVGRERPSDSSTTTDRETKGESETKTNSDTNNTNSDGKKSRAMRYEELGLRNSVRHSVHGIRSEEVWYPPRMSSVERETVLRGARLLPVTTAQQTAVRDWLQTVLGLSLLEGEGGYYFHCDIRTEGSTASPALSASVGTPVLPLSQDRLRNGFLLSLLLHRLEPDACTHAKLHSLIHRCTSTSQTLTVRQCVENVERCLWLFRLRRCPPLPLHLLIQADEVVKGNRSVLWGLLYEVMQSYWGDTTERERETARERDSAKYSTGSSFGALKPLPINASFRYSSGSNPMGLLPQHSDHTLPYSPEERRKLDQALLDWLDRTGVLATVMGGSTGDRPIGPLSSSNPIGMVSRPPTILALESYVKDGTLLCVLVTQTMRLPLPNRTYHTRPHTYSQCVANVHQCTRALRACRSMSVRYLYEGVEEEVVRGRWDSVLGLLEDMHVFHDRVSEYLRMQGTDEGVVSDNNKGYQGLVLPQSFHDYPYLGVRSLHGHGRVGRERQRERERELEVEREREAKERERDTGNTLPLWVHQSTNTSSVGVTNPIGIPPATSTNNNTYNNMSRDVSGKRVSLSLDSMLDVEREGERVFAPSLSLKQSLDYEPILPPNANTSNTSNIDNSSTSEKKTNRAVLYAPSIDDKTDVRLSLKDPIQTRSSLRDIMPVVSLAPHTLSHSQRVSDDERERDYPSAAAMTSLDPAMPAVSLPLSRSQSLPFPADVTHALRSNPYNSRPIGPLKGSVLEGDSMSVSLVEALSIEDDSSDDERKGERDLDDSLLATGVTDVGKGVYANVLLNVLMKWLADVGLRVSLDDDERDGEREGETVDDVTRFGRLFTDGVLLGRLVQKLERMSIPGFELKPKTQAQRLQNVRRSLECLADRNKRLTLRSLSVEEEVLAGDGLVMLTLLDNIRKAYALHR